MRTRQGFTIVEATISLVIVSVVLVAALSTVGASQAMRFRSDRRSRGLLLAQDLMNEILQLPYADPDQTPVNGLEPGEGSVDRTAFDDIDDYGGWVGSPVVHVDGTAVLNATGFTREVSVEWLNATNLLLTFGSETGMKRIRVKITAGGQEIVTLEAMRASVGGAVGVAAVAVKM